MSIYGDGSDGTLNVSSGTTSLSLNQKYQFSSVTIASGATLSTGSTTGAVLYILCSGTFTLNGFIDVGNRVTYGNNTWSVTLDGTSYSSPGVAQGGYGGYATGNAGGTPGDGFGGGGAGGSDNSEFYYGGNGGNGSNTYGVGGAGIYVGSGAGVQVGFNGNAGGNGSGGGGASVAANRGYANSGAGGNAYGANGGNASAGSLQPPAGGAEAGGGGGAGGLAGRAGVHIVIKARTLVLNGEILTNGSNGGRGGNGGSAAMLGSFDVESGAGGGGGGGGNAGNIYLTYSDSLTDTSTMIRTGGTAGSGGSSASAVGGYVGYSGSAGSVSYARLVLAETNVNGGGIVTPTFESASLTVTTLGSITSRANYSTVIQALPQKDYEYRVFDSDNNFIGIWQDVTSEFGYSQSINQNASEINVQIARSPENRLVKFDQLLDASNAVILDNNSDAILLQTETANAVGPGTDIDINYNIVVVAFYGGYDALLDASSDEILDEVNEPILAQYGNPNGKTVYRGYVVDYELTYGKNMGVEVLVVPHATEMDHYIYLSSLGKTTVDYLNTDPVLMARQNMTNYISQGGVITYDTSSMPLSGFTSDYSFKLQTTREVNDKTIDLLPSGYYHFVDPADNIQYLLTKSITAHHTFYYEREITELRLKKSITQLVNKAYFHGGEYDPVGYPGEDLYKYYTDAPSISGYRPGLTRDSDSRVLLVDSADALMESKIEQYKVPRYRTTVEITDAKYDIETIKLGQMVAFKNFGTFVDTLILQIVSFRRSKHSVSLDLDMIVPDDTKRMTELKRDLRSQDARTLPDEPS